MSTVITSDLVGYSDSNNLSRNVRNDNIRFSLSVHCNSVPFSENIGIDPNIVNYTNNEVLQYSLYNTFANLGLTINSIENNYGTIKVICSNGEEIDLS
jgi:hypothetical protein